MTPSPSVMVESRDAVELNQSLHERDAAEAQSSVYSASSSV